MAKRHHSASSSLLIIASIACIAASIAFMVFDYKGKLSFVRNTVHTYISSPVKHASQWPSKAAQQFGLFFVEKNTLEQENRRLKAELTWLKANLAHQSTIEAEYRRIKRLLESSVNRTQPVMIAEVIDSHIDANKHHIEINKGRNHHTFEDQVVVDKNGLIGQVVQADDTQSQIALITDTRQMVPAFIQRNNTRVMVRGSGELDRLDLDFVNKSTDIRVGDTLVTSGLGKRYPRGYAVGVITDIQASSTSDFLSVTARPLADLDTVLEVLLVSPVDEANSRPVFPQPLPEEQQ